MAESVCRSWKNHLTALVSASHLCYFLRSCGMIDRQAAVCALITTWHIRREDPSNSLLTSRWSRTQTLNGKAAKSTENEEKTDDCRSLKFN